VITLLILPAGLAYAHDLKVIHSVAPKHTIQVYCWYNGLPRPTDASGAEVEVQRSGREPIKGVADGQGLFTFSYDRVEEMTITARQGTHVSRPPDVVHVDELEGKKGSGSASAWSNTTVPDRSSAEAQDDKSQSPDTRADMHKAAEQSSIQLIKDLLLGVCVIFAVAAFVISLRNSQHVREIRKLLEERQTIPK
jgi:hypothetical protein